ncbi:MAG: D-aminopeptidase [Dehalococcoidia bacterium]|nr:D-aminopeptidase [Chloroflexota bacterium]MBT9162369.1 D-aminopeptidase [Chloroflexota bacterium]
MLEDSWTGIVVEVCLTGLRVGETGLLNAALAGAYGRPVVLVTGNRAATEEGRTLLGNIETVTVKDGVMRTAARCFPPQKAIGSEGARGGDGQSVSRRFD